MNISLFRNGEYFHLLRIALLKDDFYVHFVSTCKDKIPTSDGDSITDMHLPDHISYHKDGTVHIKHKEGKYSKVPFKLPEKFLSLDKIYNVPLLAISFYEKGLSLPGNGLSKPLDKEPVDHIIIDSCNTTFTIFFMIQDTTNIPNQERNINIIAKLGGYVPTNTDRSVLNGKEGHPLMYANLNPNLETYQDDLKLFSEEEVANADRFYDNLAKRFETIEF